jgi:Bacterial antitoxin of type II TA system, VapB
MIYSRNSSDEAIDIVTNLNIDNTLIQEAIDLAPEQTPDEIVEEALRQYIQRRKQLKIIDSFGTIDYEDYDYDHKQQRQQA